MSNVLEQIKSRRSIRKYSTEIPPQEMIDQMIEAGLYAASGKGTQNTIIIQVTDRELRDEISRRNCNIGSLVMGNLMLAAHELGLGSCWIHRAKEEFETEWGKELLRSLDIEEEYEGIGHCAFGYIEGEVPKAADRKSNRVFYIK